MGDAFVAVAQQFPEVLAYVEGDQRMTFAEWFRRSDALATDLLHGGLQAGDVVSILLPSSIDYAVMFGAAVLAGAVVTGLNTRLGVKEVEAILGQLHSHTIVVDPDSFSFPVVDFAQRAPHQRILLRAHMKTSRGGEETQYHRVLRKSDDPVVIIWTSGTTGIPKGAWFDHRSMLAAVASAGVMSRGFDVKLVSTPFAHAGYMAKMWDQIAWVTTAVISPQPWCAADMLRLLIDERVTVAGGVPTQWAKLLQEPGIDSADLSHLRLGLVATAPASPELIERVAATIGCPLVVRYAMTESPSITGTEPHDDPQVQTRTVGRAQFGMSVQVVDDGGHQVSVGSVGRVRVRGSCVMRGYWNNPTLTTACLDTKGWLTSTDLGRFDALGNLVLVGRTNDMYIRGGYNVYPLEIENLLAEHPAVDRAAVVGVPAAVIGEMGVAFVVPVDFQSPPTLNDVRFWVSQHLADYKMPDRLEIVSELPLTAMMKVDRQVLSELAEGTGGFLQ